MKIQPLWTIEVGEEFNFFGVPDKLDVGDVIRIHNFKESVYGTARITRVLSPNAYKAMRIT